MPIVGNAEPPSSFSIPPQYESMVRALDGHGLANPSGGVFSQVEVRDELPWARQNDLTYGWVMPPGTHAVLVNGMLKKVEKNLGPRDLRKYLELDDPRQNSPWYGGNNTILMSALVLLSGDRELASQAGGLHFQQGYQTTLIDLLNAVMHGHRLEAAIQMSKFDDNAALQEALVVEEVLDIGRKMNFFLLPYQPYEGRLYFDPPPLLEDIRRRIANPVFRPIPENLATMTQGERIKSLILSLENLIDTDIEWGPGKDNILTLVRREGPAIVPALLDALEQDRRWTRKLRLYNGNGYLVRLMSVREAAWELLVALWPAASGLTPNASDPDPHCLRNYWATNPTLSPWSWDLTLLKLDERSHWSWSVPANRLKAACTKTPPATDFQEFKRANGDAVAQAMRARIAACLKTENAANTGCELYHALVAWEGKHSPDLIRQLIQKCLVNNRPTGSTQYFDSYLGDLFLDLYAAEGDLSLPEIESAMSRQIKYYLPHASFFRAVFVNAATDKLESSRKRVMQAVTASLNPSADLNYGLDWVENLGSWLRSPLIALPEVRKFMAKLLTDRRQVGVIELKPTTSSTILQQQFSIPSGLRIYSIATYRFVETKPADGKIPVTFADTIASKFIGLRGAPKFEMLEDPNLKASKLREFRDWLNDKSVDWQAISNDKQSYY